jgi:hypothetical protein
MARGKMALAVALSNNGVDRAAKRLTLPWLKSYSRLRWGVSRETFSPVDCMSGAREVKV